MPAQKSFGFTLVELLVVISIMALLSLVSFAKIGTLREDQDLKAAASDLQNLIRAAQSNATSNVKCDGIFGATWIVEFTTDNKTINLKCGTANFVQKTLTLTNNVEMVLTCSPGIQVRFAPLYGTVEFKDPLLDSCSNSSNLVITLQKTGGSLTKSVTINKGGSIDIQQ